MQTTVSHIVELQEPLHEQIVQFLDAHPEWDCDRLMNTAVSLFFLQSHPDQIAARESARIYLHEMFSVSKAQKNGH